MYLLPLKNQCKCKDKFNLKVSFLLKMYSEIHPLSIKLALFSILLLMKEFKEMDTVIHLPLSGKINWYNF